MTQDECIAMYLQVSKELCNNSEWCWTGVGEPLQMFAKLVAAKERKACAKIVEDSPSYDWHKFACEAAAAIRAKGEQT